MSKILITGATGTNGQALIKQLTLANQDFVIAARNVTEARKKISSDKPFVTFAFDQPETFAEATSGIDKVFLLGPPLTLKMDALLTPFIDHLKQSGIVRVVYLSALKSETMGESLDFHVKIEQKLIHEGFNYTILRPSFFAQNFKNYEWENITERGITFMTAGEGKVGFIDVNDTAAVAAKVLTEIGHERQIYELTGPELLSYSDVASILTDVLQKDIVYPNPTPEVFKKVLAETGAPNFIADYLVDVYSIIANGHVNFLTDDVQKILGRKPNTLKTVLESDFRK